MNISASDRARLLKAQQGELDGVATYLRLAELVSNETDAKTFKRLAADEGRHAAVFKQYTGEVLQPKRLQAIAVAAAYRLLGKRILYPIIARFEYSAVPGYEQLMKDYPEVGSVKDDEKRHGDTLKALLGNGEYNDSPLILPIASVALLVLSIFYRRRMYHGQSDRFLKGTDKTQEG